MRERKERGEENRGKYLLKIKYSRAEKFPFKRTSWQQLLEHAISQNQIYNIFFKENFSDKTQ